MQLPEPKTLGSIVFTNDYQVASQEGTIGDPDSLGIFLPTLIRSANMLGELIELGAFTGASAHGAGRGFRMRIDDEAVTLSLLGSVYNFSATEGQMQASRYNYFPLFGNSIHLESLLSGLKGLHWFGFRDSESNTWQQVYLNKSLEPESIQKATLMALQADVLLKNHDLPRRRIRLAFANGVFNLWFASNDDIMMLAQTLVDTATQKCIEQAGEAFLLGAVASS